MELGNKNHPQRIAPVPRLTSDLHALHKMFQFDTPTTVNMRSTRVYQVIYGFGDASGDGFGDSFLQLKGLKYYVMELRHNMGLMP